MEGDRKGQGKRRRGRDGKERNGKIKGDFLLQLRGPTPPSQRAYGTVYVTEETAAAIFAPPFLLVN